MKVSLKKLNDRAVVPTYGSPFSAGGDLYSAEESEVVIGPGKTAMIGTGLAMEIPEGYVGLIYARSGLATKRGLAPANKVGVIDSDYRGELRVPMVNLSTESYTIQPGERVAQLCIAPVWQANFAPVDELSDSQRGAGGFGSTGKL